MPDNSNIPMLDSVGNFVEVDPSQSAELSKLGYQQPSSEQLLQYSKDQTYSTPKQQALTGIEGLGNTLSGGLFTGAERLTGIDPEDIRGRQETNPGTYMAGQAAGILGGAGAVLGKAGAAAAEATGLGANALQNAPLIQRATATAVKQATEMALLQSGDEVAKAFASDPHQTVGSAINNIGMSALGGGIIGGAGHFVAEPLWNAVGGPKLAQIMDASKAKVMGHEGADIAADMGFVPQSSEVKAAISGNDSARDAAQYLNESPSLAGKAYRKSMEDFQGDANKSILESLGKIDESVPLSDNQHGSNVKSALQTELQGYLDPVKNAYEPIQEKFSQVDLLPGQKGQIAEQLGQLALKEGYNLSESSPMLKEINRVIEDLPNIKTLEDLRKYQGIARDNAGDLGGYRLGKQIVGILRNGEEDVLQSSIEKGAPELLQQHNEAKALYKGLMSSVDELNDRLHVGKYSGPESFMKALSDTKPEDVVRRLLGANDADLLEKMSQTLPRTAEAVKNYHLDQLLDSTKNGEFDSRKFFGKMQNMSPELKNFVLGDSQPKLNGIRAALSAIPARTNTSGTARTLLSLLKDLPGGIGMLVSAISGHNPFAGLILGKMGRILGREAPDAVKLAYLKMLGSEATSNPAAFKAVFKLADAAYKGADIAEKATKNVFRSNVIPLADYQIPGVKQLDKLSKMVQVASLDPERMQDSTGDVGHYAPEHATAMGTVIARATSYLAQLKPKTDQMGPLNGPKQPTAMEKASYSRALENVEQPLMVLNRIKDGTLSRADMTTMQAVYPEYTQHLQAKLMQEMNDAISKGQKIPYKTQLGLSAFLGQPLNASIMPQNVMMNQQLGQPMVQPQQAPQKGNKTKLQGLSKGSQMDSTPNQAREAQRMTK